MQLMRMMEYSDGTSDEKDTMKREGDEQQGQLIPAATGLVIGQAMTTHNSMWWSLRFSRPVEAVF